MVAVDTAAVGSEGVGGGGTTAGAAGCCSSFRDW